MPKKRLGAEQIVTKLRQIEVLQGQGKSLAVACRRSARPSRGGIEVGNDRIQRIWRREGLKVPKKQSKRSRLWLNDGSCILLRPAYPNLSGPSTLWKREPMTAGACG